MKNLLIVISGATACGKTDCSINLAKEINGEIISADSMQVYKYMDIGTAKIKQEEMQEIKHYLIDEIYPDEEFSIAKFKSFAKNYIEKINSKNKIPIIVGGTGFYINSIIYDNDFENSKKNTSIREKLQKLADEKGSEYLYSILKDIDYLSYKKIHFNNTKKIIRAIEFFEETGQKISEHNLKQKEKVKAYNSKFFVLNMDRDILYDRINYRVDLMIKQGLLNEVNSLLEKGYNKNLVSMQGIGYKEIVSYLDGEISFEEAVYLIKRNTRRFAKRQLTWFKNQVEDAIWIDVCKYNKDELVQEIIKNIDF